MLRKPTLWNNLSLRFAASGLLQSSSQLKRNSRSMRGIPFLYLTDNRPDFSGRLFLKRGTLAIAERLGRFSAPKRCRNGIMDLLHFKISEYGISIAFRIPGTEISLNNSDEYLGAGFLKI